MKDRRSFLKAAGAVALCSQRSVRAQSFPSRAISLYCGFPAGGTTDQVIRAFCEAASRTLGQAVVVENKPGGGGTVAPIAMRSARPDGYTLAQMPISMFRIPHMQKSQTFDPIKDFTYIINLTGNTFGFVVLADSPIESIKDLVEHAKANPGSFTYGSPGIGTSPHLAVEELALRAGIRLNHVPFKGTSELIQGIIGGHIMGVSDGSGWGPYVESGRLRLLATYGSKRTKRWPQVPTLNELGYEIVANAPFGVAGPRDLDPNALRILHDAFRAATEDAGVMKMLERYDQPIMYMSASEYASWAKQTFEAERGTIDRLGMRGTL